MPLRTNGLAHKFFPDVADAIRWAEETLTGDAENDAERRRFCIEVRRVNQPPNTTIKALFDGTGALLHLELYDADGDLIGYP